jgi:hypothetical protein
LLKRTLPVGFACTPTTANLMGFFDFMYTTQTKIKNGFAVVKVYENKEYWHTYEFPIQSNYNFIYHISGKVWGTVGVLSEIKNALKHYNNERMD